MRIYLDCIPCFIRQALDAARHATDDEHVHEQVVRGVLDLSNNLDMHQSPPVIGQQIHQLIRKLVRVEDPYHGLKQRFNDIALKLYSKMRHIIIESEDPLETAVRVAIAGNIIDLGAKSQLPKTELEETIDQCLSGELSAKQLKDFQNAVNEAKNILYLSDNAGEIVFDRLLIEQLPIDKITVAVKGYPVINDATMEDAIHAGLPQMVDVIDNGSDAPGTILPSCSRAFRDYFNKADLIIAKGQGNYETLNDVNQNIFFILKVKCPVIAKDIGCNVGEMILQKTKAFKGEKENARI
ncbi:MAG: DUF89 family protein [Sedimentisphaerales bacterium]|nr:DUF89 family protein [Sedimentisphaerales bacterium]